jgi:hypothetical protein
MRGTCLFLLATVFALSTWSSEAQKATLTDAEIEAAIANGIKDKKKIHGLLLQDSGQNFLAAMSNNKNGRPSTGFSVVLYTPTTWISKQAADATKQYKEFTRADVDEKMLAPLLRVYVNPDMPREVSGRGMAGTSSVEHVVIRDEARKNVIQPEYKEEFTDEAQNAFGARKEYVGVIAEFPIGSVQQFRTSGDGEFFVTVVGATGEEKNFKVKKKHFERLP